MSIDNNTQDILRIEGDCLRKLQETELEILCAIDDFCRSNSLQYFLTSGTLLGAVRHGGFIPWDDDVDISMPRKDFGRFLQLADSFPDGFVVQHTSIDGISPLPIAKVRMKGTVMREAGTANLGICHGVWVDVFPLDKVVSDANLSTRAKLIDIMSMAIGIKSKSRSPKGLTRLACRLLGLLPNGQLDRIRTRVMAWDEKSPANYFTSFASNLGCVRLLMETSVYYPCKEIAFEGRSFLCPSNPDKWLEKAYGDYLLLPPEEDRHNTHDIVELKL